MGMNNQPELMGSGLSCSQVLSQSADDKIDFDNRILGFGELVTELRGRLNIVSEARRIYCFCAVRQLHRPAAEITRYLEISLLLFNVR